MRTKAYTTLGWMAWQGIVIITRRKLSDNKVKLGALGTVLLVLIAGVGAAKAASGDD